MKFPYSMLLDFVETTLSAEEVGDLLTMAGFELEGIEEFEGEPVLDVKVMSNRGDGLSVFGLSRELLAKDQNSQPTDLYERASRRFPMPDQGTAGETGARTSVEIQSRGCTRYACRLFEGVRNGESPAWIQERIRKAGMRPISLVVDLTNYIMLELGQPLHSFDRDLLSGGRIVVRDARPGEKLTTLNGEEHELDPSQMMICDAEKPVGVPGVMGGLETEVSEQTQNVLLEAAHFVNTTVRRTRKQLGLSTEASYRFERSVDPELVVAALNRFAELFAAADAGTVVPGVIDEYPVKPERVVVALRLSRAQRLLNVDISAEEARRYLEKLGFGVTEEGDAFQVVVPTWRPDISREEDLIEELGRVHGYEKIPVLPPIGVTTQGKIGDFEAFVDRVREEAVRTGFVQTISHSLRDLSPLDAEGPRIGPRVPASPDTAYLRNSILSSLADDARRNGGKDLHLFEIGKVFVGEAEKTSIAFLSTGNLLPTQWIRQDPTQADFFSLKGTIEEVLQRSKVEPAFEAVQSPDARFHPTRQARITVGGRTAGVIGLIHPDVAEQLDLSNQTALAELDLGLLFQHRTSNLRLKPVSRNPAVRRDIALLIDKAVPFAKLEEAVQAALGEVLEKQWVFDLYEGSNIPAGQHSIAIALQLRKYGENFTDEEANQVREKAVRALEALGGVQR